VAVIPTFSMKKKIICTAIGRVQMVMYRDFAKRNAEKLGLVGTVQNMPDGSVRVIAEGDDSKFAEFIAILKKGSLFSHVENVVVSRAEAASGNYSDFRIVY
jgi:acylphosphatase